MFGVFVTVDDMVVVVCGSVCIGVTIAGSGSVCTTVVGCGSVGTTGCMCCGVCTTDGGCGSDVCTSIVLFVQRGECSGDDSLLVVPDDVVLGVLTDDGGEPSPLIN